MSDVERHEMPRRKPRPGEFRCQLQREDGCEMVQRHVGECGSPEEDVMDEEETTALVRAESSLLPVGHPIDFETALAERLERDPVDRRANALALAHEILEPGVRRVVVIGDRRSRAPRAPGCASEPNLHGEDGIQAGVWDPRARSVYHLEPAATGEENEFGEGASVQGFSYAEKAASYRTFLKVQRALVEMTQAATPADFMKKLAEAASHLGPNVARALEAKVAAFDRSALAPPSEPEAELLPAPSSHDDSIAGEHEEVLRAIEEH